ncbi:hypothetical protein M426DRAFT_79558 [Hypoxylon sp. CI-4A]|nr:hypothetical protein M426DRAFT_79558 [Hypoxylon sp. CI-4A]
MRFSAGLWLLWRIILWLPRVVTAIAAENSSTNLVSIYEPYLSHLNEKPFNFNPYVGGLNWSMCCYLVVNESLFIDNNTLFIRDNQTFFTGHNISILEEYPRFPCGATYEGTLNAPPTQFWASYSWCNAKCPGWPVTRASDFNRWLKPLIAFILPSLIFCLNIPRRRRLELPAQLFSNKSIDASNLLLVILKVPIASLVVTLDIVIWTCVVFSTASPMITSGLYEAFLDARVLTYLESRTNDNIYTEKEKAHTLLSILIGNLDIDAWDSSRLFVEGLPGREIRPSASNDRIMATPNTSRLNSATSHRSHDDILPNTPGGGHSKPISDSWRVDTVKWRLRAMLDSQVSFGSSVGAPVLFYIASFVWSVYEVREDLGSYVTAHQLAAGMFWMTIPHIALVSCLLLAGNNPNIWQSAVTESFFSHNNSQRPGRLALEPFYNGVRGYNTEIPINTSTVPNQPKSFISRIFDHVFVLAYRESAFRPAWMWNRGSSKALWVWKLGQQYPHLRNMYNEVLEDRFGKDLWASSFFGFFLYFVPIFFGTLVSYNTPQAGFGCRSIVILVYAVSQFVLQLLWVLRWYSFDRGERRKNNSFLYRAAKSTMVSYVWYSLFALATFLGALSSIAGTIFTLINVLTNCFCALPAQYWWSRWTNPDALIFFDDSTKDQLDYAQRYWFPAGVVSVVFMVIVAYIGWWYQRSLRHRFSDLVDKIDYVFEMNLDEFQDGTYNDGGNSTRGEDAPSERM